MSALLGDEDEDAGPVERRLPPEQLASLRRPGPDPAGADERLCAPRRDREPPPLPPRRTEADMNKPITVLNE